VNSTKCRGINRTIGLFSQEKGFPPAISNDYQDKYLGVLQLIAKKRTIPREILILEAVVARMPPDHPRKAEFHTKLIKRKAGYKGEKELDYHLEQLPEKDFIIIQDLRLPHKHTFFQLDNLLLGPSFFLNLESKYFSGALEFDQEFDQMIRTINDTQQAYLNPILQAKIQTSRFRTWLAAHQFTPPPIEYFVTITSQQSIIKNPGHNKEVSYRVCRSARIPFKIDDVKNKFHSDVFTKKEISKLTRLLIKSHEPLIPDSNSLNLPLADLITGVQCPRCAAFRMERTFGNWYCKACGHTSKDAHGAAIRDYFLLFNPSITNLQLRKFLHLDSADTATRILHSLDLTAAGAKKNRYYSPPKNHFTGP
jgi:hypothetical protein